VRRDPDAHDWGPFIRYTLECEGHVDPTDDQVREREEVTRAKITRLLQVDGRRANPFVDGSERRYGTVISPYCADSATHDRAIWETFMRNISGLVRPGGTFVTAALRRCRGYVVGDKRFPGADVDEADIRGVLECGFGPSQSVEVRDLGGHEDQGYSGIVLARASRGRA
jgi:NNMT/PNMT/TEMT family